MRKARTEKRYKAMKKVTTITFESSFCDELEVAERWKV